MKAKTMCIDPISELIDRLDKLTVDALNAYTSAYQGATWYEIGKAFDAVVDHPASRWTRKDLSARQKNFHFKR
jgi:hypothetical protein